EVLSVDEAWNKYGIGNGDESKDSFMRRMNEMFETDTNNGQIGCIILSDFKLFDNAVYLSNVGIEFKNSVVSGKGISATEVNTINEYAFGKVESFMCRLNEANNIGFTEDNDGFHEGMLIFKQHLIRELNYKIITLDQVQYTHQYDKLIRLV